MSAVRRHGLARTPECAYCGDRSSRLEKEHAIPGCLYPPSKARSRVQRLTIPACAPCNRGWSDDEAHFRNVLLLAGSSNALVTELWRGPTARSFRERDGARRLRELAALLKQVEVDGEPRHMIYPAKDPRVLRVVRKVVRGLCYHHGQGAPVSDGRVWVDVMRFAVPPAFLEDMTTWHREPDVLEYQLGVIDDVGMQTVWLLKFFERTTFIAIVFESEESCQRSESRDAHGP
jgi:hypothetical protein